MDVKIQIAPSSGDQFEVRIIGPSAWRTAIRGSLDTCWSEANRWSQVLGVDVERVQ